MPTAKKTVLVAEDDPIIARMLQQTLQRAGYVVVTCGDGKTAADKLERDTFDAILTDWMMPELDGIELVRRARNRPTAIYKALISELNIPAAIAHAKQAGADDFFAKPVVPARLLEALGAWFARGPAPLPATASRGGHPLACTESWKTLPSALRQVLTDTIQIPLGALDPWSETPKDAVVRSVKMTDVEHQMHLYLVVEAPRPAAHAVAAAMLGEVDASDTQAIEDVFSELANIAAGNVKMMFGKEGFTFTMGLPSATAVGDAEHPLRAQVGVRAEGIEVVMRLCVGAQQAVRLAAAELREGMVLAENVHNEAGQLLLPAGTRLTATASARLASFLKGRAVLVTPSA